MMPHPHAGIPSWWRLVDGADFAPNGAGIQAAIESLGPTGGDVILDLPQYVQTEPLYITGHNVRLIGRGADANVGGGAFYAGTTLRWEGLQGGPMVVITAQSGTPNTVKRSGIERVFLNGRAVAGFGVQMFSTHACHVKECFFGNIEGWDIDMGVVASITADARDCQWNTIEDISTRKAETQNGGTLHMRGDAGANCCWNRIVHIDAEHTGIPSLLLEEADNNRFFAWKTSKRWEHPDVPGALINGQFLATNNYFIVASFGVGGFVQQSVGAYPDGGNVIIGHDRGNGEPEPVVLHGKLDYTSTGINSTGWHF